MTATPNQDGPTIPVFLVDDHELLRRGLQDILDAAPGICVVGQAGTVRDAVRRIPASRPAVMVLDVQLPDGTGIDVCRKVRSVDPTIHALMLTTFDDSESRAAAALAGASGFVLKQIRPADLLDAVRRVAAGEALVDAASRASAVDELARERDALDLLTPRERWVLDLVAEGLTNAQIGARLGIGEKTVKNHVTSVLFKLGFNRRTQAAVYLTQRQERHDRLRLTTAAVGAPPGSRRF